MKRNFSLMLMLTTLTSVGSYFAAPARSAEPKPVPSPSAAAQPVSESQRMSKAKQCFMELNLSPRQKIRLMALRTKTNLTASQRLDEAVGVLDDQQSQKFRQCSAT
jgi:hypothetical protein